MGQQLPPTKNPIVYTDPTAMFESTYIQRVKDSPFIDAILYTSKPPIFIDPLGPDLHQLISPRIGTKQLFPEPEVVNIIRCVLGGLSDLVEHGFEGHGDVCLETICYSPKDKGFKLAHPVFNEQSGYLLTKHGKRFTTLSPEQLSALSEDSQQPEVSVESDIFAFGILLCQICTLTPSSDIYCPDTYSIFHLQIQKRTQLVEQYYSPFISEFILKCLEYDPEARANLAELSTFIAQNSVPEEQTMSNTRKNPQR